MAGGRHECVFDGTTWDIDTEFVGKHSMIYTVTRSFLGFQRVYRNFVYFVQDYLRYSLWHSTVLS